MRERVSYSGQKVFVGIDVHRGSYTATAISEGVVVKRWRTVADPEHFIEQLHRYFQGADIHSCYEAGFSGFVLHRFLSEHGIENIVVHTGSIEVSSRDTVKTDRKDSLKLASLLAAGRLRGIRVPSVDEEVKRQLSRSRIQLIRARSRIMNQIRMRLHYFGLLPAASLRLTRVRVMKLSRTANCPEELALVLELSCELWESLEEKIQKLDKILRRQGEADWRERVYRSVPGIGKINARILSNELGDMSQFPNERCLFSFTGLTPMEFSSGDTRRLSHISRQGNSRLRAALVESAWVAIRKDLELRLSFDRIAVRAGKKRAIVAIARKLIGRVRAAFRQGELYCVEAKRAA